MNPVKTKQDFVRRYQKGEFGNASPTWEISDFLNGKVKCYKPDVLFHLRNRVVGGATYYDLTPKKLLELLVVINDSEYPNYYISEMAPTDKTIIQGEIVQSRDHLNLLYSTVKKPMRDALAEQSIGCYGLEATLILRRHLCYSSQEWINHLLDTYPGHVIEFSTYSINWGTIPGMNTVFWEVRKY